MAVKFYTGVDLQSQRAINAADPTSPTDLATKEYVDNALAGLQWKQPVTVATTTNGALSTAYANGQVVDGVTLATGMRILLQAQTSQPDNGIYTVNASGAPTRSTDASTAAELTAATVLVTSGTVNADKAFTQTAVNPTIGTTNITWVQFGAGITYTADNNGITLSGTQFQLVLNGTSLAKSASGLQVGSGAAGSGLTYSSGALAVNPGTGLEVVSNAIRIATSAAGAGLTGGGGSALAINTSTVVQKYATTIGDGSTTSFTVTHGLGTQDVRTTLYSTSTPYSVFNADVSNTSTTTITVAFAVAPAASSVRVVVHG